MNLGIILAMAGLDYSRVKEPDYNPDKIRQKQDIDKYIERLAEKVMNAWQTRDQECKKLYAGKDIDERTRSIFYDTDGIVEKQHETIRICPDCGGALKIDSSSDIGSHILAVHIPAHACKKCVETGYQWYESANLKHFNHVFLQDRTTDKYLKKDK